MSTPVDPARCPLCGADNRCAMAADPPASECWCYQATIAPAALARVPPEARGVACVCSRCATDGKRVAEHAEAGADNRSDQGDHQ